MNISTAEWFDVAFIPYKDFVSSVSAGTMGAYGNLVTAEVDGKRNAVLNRIAANLFSEYVGAIGKVAAGGISGADITLDRTRDIRNFKEGMVLQMDTTDGSSGSVHSGTVTIASINRSTGVITCTGNVTSGIASAAAGDYIFRNGDFGKGFMGLGKWTETVSNGESFYGVDRYDYSALQGLQHTVSGDRVEGIIDGLETLATLGDGVADIVVVNPLVWAELSKNLQSESLQAPGGEGKFSFKALTVSFAGGSAKVIGDPWCPSDRGYATELANLELIYHSPKKYIVIAQNDFATIAGSGDDYTIRLAAYTALKCKAPNKLLRLSFS
jgi:hypothetical protein